MTTRKSKAERKASERVDEILDAIRKIEECTRNHSLEEFRAEAHRTSGLGVAAIERYLERLVEASRHLPESLQATEPDIGWRDIATLGKLLRHQYHRIDIELLWKYCTKELPILKLAMERIKRRV